MPAGQGASPAPDRARANGRGQWIAPAVGRSTVLGRTHPNPYDPASIYKLKRKGLGDFLDFAGADTGSADAQPLAGAVDKRANGLQVHVPAAFSDIMGVADAVPELRAAATNFAYFRHSTEISLRLNL